jgi:lipopolysaccharide transport system ATP-binding protein
MNNSAAILAVGLSKQYQLGARQERYRTLRESLMASASVPVRAARTLFKRQRKALAPTVWALKDVSLEIKRGDVVGIVGRNGAGKSTLLKVLSRITRPTTGFAEVRGRVSSLLEVGTGFHNELTGRENIILNGAILGMRKREIERKFDEIVAFAEVERFIDTPVKRYSSGMYLRLAFAVAAHLEPDVLVVDEVLAVGDIAFQKKCLGKLEDVAKQGRTVLFVSHNMGAIRSMCQTGIVLDKGTVVESGDVSRAIESYYRLVGGLQGNDATEDVQGNGASGFGPVKIDCDGTRTVSQGSEFKVATTIKLNENAAGFALLCALDDMQGRTVFILRETNATLDVPEVRSGIYAVELQFPALWLNPGLYTFSFKVQLSGVFGSSRYVSDRVPFDVNGVSSPVDRALLHPAAKWNISA